MSKNVSKLNINIDFNKKEFFNREKNIELLKEYKITNDINLRNELIEGNMGLILNVINKEYSHFLMENINHSVEANDLFSFGVIGLIGAIERVKIDKLECFPSYAYTTIKYSIKEHLFKYRGKLSGTLNLYKICEQIKTMKLKDEFITDKEMANKLNISLGQLNRAKSVTGKDFYFYIDEAYAPSAEKTTNNEFDGHRYLCIESPFLEKIQNEELKEFIKNMFNDRRIYGKSNSLFNKRDTVLRMFKLKFVENLTYEEIGKEYNFTKQRISQIIHLVKRNILRYYNNEIKELVYN